jgi:hypothetical protein
MQTGIEGVGYLFLAALMFFLFCCYLSFWKHKVRVMLVIVLTAITPLYGCAAGQVMVASSEYENVNCASLDNELGIAQTRLHKLESTNTTERDVRNFLLGVGGFFLPPLGIINVTLFLTDSYAADYTETKALESSYNNMVMVSQGQGCGSAYALITDEEKTEPNAL